MVLSVSAATCVVVADSIASVELSVLPVSSLVVLESAVVSVRKSMIVSSGVWSSMSSSKRWTGTSVVVVSFVLSKPKVLRSSFPSVVVSSFSSVVT